MYRSLEWLEEIYLLLCICIILELVVFHMPFSDQFQHMVEQIQFDRTKFTMHFNGASPPICNNISNKWLTNYNYLF